MASKIDRFKFLGESFIVRKTFYLENLEIFKLVDVC